MYKEYNKYMKRIIIRLLNEIIIAIIWKDKCSFTFSNFIILLLSSIIILSQNLKNIFKQ